MDEDSQIYQKNKRISIHIKVRKKQTLTYIDGITKIDERQANETGLQQGTTREQATYISQQKAKKNI